MSTENKNYPLIKETDSNGNPLNAYDQLVTESNNFRRAVDKDINNLDGRVTGKSAQSPSESEVIPANSNMNSYTTPGFYHSARNVDLATVANHPSGNAGSLMVLKNAGTTQFWVDYLRDFPKMYVRNQHGGSWGNWRKF